MGEEHGYQRSGKKCREKFENLYKYYKKTKEGKAGRQDGKHYRFFRQLDALYGETSNNNNNHHQQQYLVNADATFLYQTRPRTATNQENQESNNNKMSDQSLSLSNTSDFETSSSDNNDDGDLSAIASCMVNRCMEKKQKGKVEKKKWKEKVKDMVEIQMRKLFEKQEAWMERMVKRIEDREQERMFREEEWTKQEAARLDRIHELWAKEKAWIEARDVALMEALNSKGLELSSSSIEQILMATECHYKNQHLYDRKIGIDHVHGGSKWSEAEIFSLIQMRTSMESRTAEESSSDECLKQGLWEEIARRMACLGYDRSVDECKEKWGNMNVFFNNQTDREEGIMKGKQD